MSCLMLKTSTPATDDYLDAAMTITSNPKLLKIPLAQRAIPQARLNSARHYTLPNMANYSTKTSKSKKTISS